MRKKQNIIPTNGDGELHGLCIVYYNNGNIDYKQRYVNGKCNGIREWYRSDGDLWSKDYLLKGKCVYGEWYGGRKEIKFRV